MDLNENNLFQLKLLLSMCYKIYARYSWLLDAYVSDFFVHNHWYNLPVCWRESLWNLEPELISNIIQPNKPLRSSQVFPLSLLALRQSIKYFSISRTQQYVNTNMHQTASDSLLNEDIFLMPHFKQAFWKRVKSKKKHEIEIMSAMCYKLAAESNCYYIVDVGSGLGHLSRILSYGYGLKVCALEAQKYLSEEARKLDREMENNIIKYFNRPLNKNLRPLHISIVIDTASDGEDILRIIKEAFGNATDNLSFGIVGLHPCGDLGPTLLRLFVKSPQVKFINIVGCCYMKLSTSESTSKRGYPLSTYGLQNNYDLSYCAREVACHALEAYVEKLHDGQCWKLKVHAFRAALEKLIVTQWSDLYHSQVCSVKCNKDLTFSEYCRKATANLNIQLEKTKIESELIQKDLKKWKNVVTFYSLRLLMAPLVETIILLDRQLYLMESNTRCEVVSIFNPQLSPRNQVLTGFKI